MSKFARLLPVVLLVFSASALRAADDIYIQFPGTTGDSLDKTHPGSSGWSAIASFSHCGSNPYTLGGGPGAAQTCEVSLTKQIGRQTTGIIQSMNTGKGFTTTPYSVTIEICRSTVTTPFCYYKIQLRNVFVTSVSQSDSTGADSVYDNLSLAFTAIKWTYTPQKADGTADTPTVTCWDFATNSLTCY